jgi:hypothetical protein
MRDSAVPYLFIAFLSRKSIVQESVCFSTELLYKVGIYVVTAVGLYHELADRELPENSSIYKEIKRSLNL